MQLQKSLWALSALAMGALAQDSGSCDPQNDSNNDATCTSSAAAMMTASASSSSSSINDNLTRLTSIDTNLIISTILDTNVMTSTLPESLATRTTGILQTIVYTSASVYTTNTLTSTGAPSTYTVIQSTSGLPNVGVGSGPSGASASASSSSSMAAAPAQTAKYVYGGLAAGLMGVAAAL